MDISYWTGLNPNILQQETVKLMHGHYLYRLTIQVVGCSILRNNQDIEDAICWRNNKQRDYNWAGSWRKKPIGNDDSNLLRIIKEQLIYHESNSKINGHELLKIRIEEPYIQFYSSQEQVLKDLASRLLYGNNFHFYSIMSPDSAEKEKLILNGFTLRKNKVKWAYRILMRDGKYSLENKGQIAAYLKNLGDDIKVPNGLWDQLEKGSWIWGGYIYVHDKNIATVLGMIDPRLIAKIEEFKSLVDEE
jgi:hypothetical protein